MDDYYFMRIFAPAVFILIGILLKFVFLQDYGLFFGAFWAIVTFMGFTFAIDARKRRIEKQKLLSKGSPIQE